MLWKRVPKQEVLVVEPGGGSGYLLTQARQVPAGGAAQGGQPVIQLHEVPLRLKRVGLAAPQLQLQALWVE